MNYHIIRTDDMLNGDGLRVVVFVSGCTKKCEGCHNPETWDFQSGKEFTLDNLTEVEKELDKDYISGITLSGGDPLEYNNLPDTYDIVYNVKKKYPNKTIWLYTGLELGYENGRGDFADVDVGWDNGLLRNHILRMCDVVCDGKFIKSKADINCPWVGSTNQRVIDVKKTIKKGEIVLYE